MPAVTWARECLARLKIPVWGGQITHRASLSLGIAKGEGMKEYDDDSSAASEIARLWQAIEKSVAVINGARERAAMHRLAA